MRNALRHHLVALPLLLLLGSGLGVGPAFVSVIDAVTGTHEHHCHCPMSEHHCSCPVCGGKADRLTETSDEDALSQAPCGDPRVSPHLVAMTVLLPRPIPSPLPIARMVMQRGFAEPTRFIPSRGDAPEPPPPKGAES